LRRRLPSPPLYIFAKRVEYKILVFAFRLIGHPSAPLIVNVQNFYPKKVFCRAVRSDHVRSEKNFLVGLKLQSELYWAFSEIVRRFQAESAAAKGEKAIWPSRNAPARLLMAGRQGW
jgi:hypothetical protein